MNCLLTWKFYMPRTYEYNRKQEIIRKNQTSEIQEEA